MPGAFQKSLAPATLHGRALHEFLLRGAELADAAKYADNDALTSFLGIVRKELFTMSSTISIA